MAELNLELSKEENKLVEYLNYLKELAKNDPPKATLISNKGELHASILLGSLLYLTKNKLKMYCTGLTPSLLHGNEGNDDSTAYWKVFQEFFNNRVGNFKDDHIEILVQSKQWENDPPFEVVRKSMREHPQKIKVKVENENSRKVVRDYWGKNESINFSIYDDNAYRLEYEPKQHIAIASLYDKKMNQELTNVFDNMYKVADEYKPAH